MHLAKENSDVPRGVVRSTRGQHSPPRAKRTNSTRSKPTLLQIDATQRQMTKTMQTNNNKKKQADARPKPTQHACEVSSASSSCADSLKNPTISSLTPLICSLATVPASDITCSADGTAPRSNLKPCPTPCSILRMSFASLSAYRVTATPARPALPVRPDRWT